jgi:hypothetical protein
VPKSNYTKAVEDLEEDRGYRINLEVSRQAAKDREYFILASIDQIATALEEHKNRSDSGPPTLQHLLSHNTYMTNRRQATDLLANRYLFYNEISTQYASLSSTSPSLFLYRRPLVYHVCECPGDPKGPCSCLNL